MTVAQELNEIALLIKRSNFNQALRRIDRLLENDPKNANLWYLRSASLENREDQRTALQRVLEYEPNHERALVVLGRMEAEDREAIENAPEGSPHYFMRMIGLASADLNALHEVAISDGILTLAELQGLLKQIRQTQKELRLIKKEIGIAMTEIRDVYAGKRSAAQTTGHIAGLVFGKRTGGHLSATRKESLRLELKQTLEPYQIISRHIDKTLITYDSGKLEVEQLIAQAKETGAS